MVPLLFGGVDVVPLQGAIVVCYGWGGDDQLWRSGHGAIAGCHCHLLRFGGRVTTNAGGVDGGRCWVPLQGAIVVCSGLPISRKRPRKQQWIWLLADATLFSTLITQKLVFAIWGLCWYNFDLLSWQILPGSGWRAWHLKISWFPWGASSVLSRQGLLFLYHDRFWTATILPFYAIFIFHGAPFWHSYLTISLNQNDVRLWDTTKGSSWRSEALLFEMVKAF